jgi:hypothetical protein
MTDKTEHPKKTKTIRCTIDVVVPKDWPDEMNHCYWVECTAPLQRVWTENGIVCQRELLPITVSFSIGPKQ